MKRKFLKKIDKIPNLPKRVETIWWLCRGLVMLWGLIMLFNGYITELFEAIFGVAFTFLWTLFQFFGGKTFIKLVPYKLQTMLNLLICFGIVVGSTVNKFTSFEHIDIPEHFFSGYIAAAGGYELAVIIQSRQPKDKRLSPALAAMFGLSFAVMLLTGWEIYEFSMDRLYGLNLQRSGDSADSGLIDTMVDLIVGVAGSLIGMFITAFSKAGHLKKNSSK